MQNNSSIDLLKENTEYLVDNIDDCLSKSLTRKIEIIKDEVTLRVESLKEDLEKYEKVFLEDIDILRTRSDYRLNIVLDLQIRHRSRRYLSNHKNILQFFCSKKNFCDREFLGNIYKYPCFETYKSIRNEEILSISGQNLWKISAHQNKEHIVISDIGENNVKIIDLNGTLVRMISSDIITIYPWTINTESTNEIIIGCLFEKGIYVFDLDFQIKRIFGEDYFSQPTSITVDKDDFIYVSDCGRGILSKWTSEGELVKQVDSNRPGQMKIFNDRLYVISSTVFKLNDDLQKLSRVTHGLNCILVYDRFSMDTIGLIKIENWLEPRGLFFDENKNICTTAFEIDESLNVSSSRSIYVFHQDMYLVNKIEIKTLKKFNDLMYFNRKLWILLKNSIRLVEFCKKKI